MIPPDGKKIRRSGCACVLEREDKECVNPSVLLLSVKLFALQVSVLSGLTEDVQKLHCGLFFWNKKGKKWQIFTDLPLWKTRN